MKIFANCCAIKMPFLTKKNCENMGIYEVFLMYYYVSMMYSFHTLNIHKTKYIKQNTLTH